MRPKKVSKPIDAKFTSLYISFGVICPTGANVTCNPTLPVGGSSLKWRGGERRG